MKKLTDLVIYQDDGYNTFPSIAVGDDGTAYVVFRHAPDRRATFGGRIIHIDPEAAVYLIKSTDNGRTWSAPLRVHSGKDLSVQDPCVNVLGDGSLLLTTFFWRVVPQDSVPMLRQVLKYGAHDIHDLPNGSSAYLDGAYSMLSKDGGVTFDGPHLIDKGYAVRGQSVELPDGTILTALYGTFQDEPGTRTVLYASRDRGFTWQPYSFVCNARGASDESPCADEPGLFRTRSGRIICFIRASVLYHCHSDDDGLTWTAPQRTDIPGNVPFHALQLANGGVLLTYGRRKAPFGIRALLLDGDCNGIRADREIVLRDDGLGEDISYTCAAQLPDGSVLVIYYYYTDQYDQRRHIAGTFLRE